MSRSNRLKTVQWLSGPLLMAFVLLAASPVSAQRQDAPLQPNSGESLLRGPDTFPIAVWLQSPHNAAKYRSIGINLYISLWNGPTEEQLTALEQAGMPVICAQNPEALKPRWKQVIVAWMHADEPDNAQSLGQDKGYGPPVLPSKIVEDCQKMKAADPSRPVFLNLGQGVAWDGWYGRGVRTNMPQDYPEYIKGGDIISFDIYPVIHTSEDVTGKLWYVGSGVQRLVKWTGGQKPVWACVECTHIDNPNTKPTPEQVRSEVWMAIINGARGITYFCHQFAPAFIEAAPLEDPAMMAGISDINKQVQAMAPVIFRGTDLKMPDSGNNHIAVMARRHAGASYVFAVEMSGQAATGHFSLPAKTQRVEALGENRTLAAKGGAWSDEFHPYQVHLYRIADGSQQTP